MSVTVFPHADNDGVCVYRAVKILIVTVFTAVMGNFQQIRRKILPGAEQTLKTAPLQITGNERGKIALSQPKHHG